MLYWVENIKYLRARLGYSQQRLADHLGMTRTRYSKYEYGLAEPSIEILLRIARYFGVSLDSLITIDLRKERGVMSLS